MSSAVESLGALHWRCRSNFFNFRHGAIKKIEAAFGREREKSMGPGIFTKYAKQVIGVCVALLAIGAIAALMFG